MTIKEIANLTGKSKRTIERWITYDKVSQATCDKMSQAIKSQCPADYSLDETIEILKAGKVSDSLISLLLENVETKKLDVNQIMNTFTSAITNLNMTLNNINQRLEKIENTPKQLPLSKKITVREYAIKNDIKSFNQPRLLMKAGRIATKLSKELNRTIQYQTNKSGYPEGLYDEDLLNTAFTLAISSEKTKDLFEL